ncbi:MAG: hypothetical protein LBQ90_11340 [Synergistaceae bacterium]|jgi:hypothetical protein|nr:hypothetical protein [Synergistaceae bacterium]
MPNTMQGDTRDLPAGTEQTPPSNEESKEYGALKGYFFTPKRGDTRGAFCLLIDGTNGEILENVFWVTYSEISIDVNLGWRDFNRAIPEMGPYEKNLGDRLSTLLLEIFPLSDRVDLMQHPEIPSRLVSTGVSVRPRTPVPP